MQPTLPVGEVKNQPLLNCLQLLPSGVSLKQLVVGKCCSQRQETALLEPWGSSLFAVRLSGLFTSEGSFAQSIKVFTRDKVGDGGQYLRQDRGRCVRTSACLHIIQTGQSSSGQPCIYLCFLWVRKMSKFLFLV